MTDRSTDSTPAQPTRDLPTGTVTFLFSDIEGSTRLLQALGTRYSDVLLDQRRLLREAFSAHDGLEIDTAGDGFFVCFNRASDAVAAAAESQRALAGHEWPDAARVRVRMGIHTGEPAITAGGDIVGIDVHRAARICSVAHGGQVLMSQVTRQLVHGDLPAGASITKLGDVRLKDIPGPEPLYQLVIDGLQSSFPSITGADSHPTNLPAPATSLIGREAEIETVCRLVLRKDVRWVTLTGPAGTGKTRLALEVGHRLLPQFTDGVFFVQLAAIENPNLMASMIAGALGLAEKPGQPVLEELQSFLGRRNLLLVLDNFEQIAGAAPVVADLLAKCDGLEVVVTSRVLLHVSAEYEFSVAPLPVPSGNGSLDRLARVPAVALFVERASAASPGFSLTEANAAAVARICNQLEGLPLAIELAATRIRLFPPAALADRLADRLNLLKGGSRDLPARHQTLRHALQWSYELLGEVQQCTFRRLGVFVGGAKLDAIEAVCNPLREYSFEVVAALLDHSLIRRVADVDGEPRLTMLETIREFALERLAEDPDELVKTGRSHAMWCLELAEQAAPFLTGTRLREWLLRLSADHDNMRAALQWAVDNGEADIGLRLATALWRFWNVAGHLTEAMDWLERVLAMPGAAAPTPLRAKTLQGLATMIHVTSDFRAALPVAYECLEICRAIGDDEGAANALNTLGWVLAGTGDIDQSLARSSEALELHTELGNRRGMALAWNNMGFAIRQTGDFGRACEYYSRSLALRREHGDPRGTAYALTNLAYAHHDRGSYEIAERMLDEALAILRDLGDDQLTAWALCHKARCALTRGEADVAAEILDECLDLWRNVSNATGLGWTYTLKVQVALERGDMAAARDAAEHARSFWAAAGVPYGLALNLIETARLEVADGQPAAALRAINEAIELNLSLRNVNAVAEAEEIRAAALLGSDSPADTIDAVAALGQAHGLREVHERRQLDRDRQRVSDLEARLRQSVPDSDFREAWRRGLDAAGETLRGLSDGSAAAAPPSTLDSDGFRNPGAADGAGDGE